MENRVVDGNVERIQREERSELVVEGKVDWKGRKALKHKHGGVKVSLLPLASVIGAAAYGIENLATLSLAVNLVSYFTGIMHYELDDAANMVTDYMGVSYMLSIVVAVFADTWIGRYKSVVISGFFEALRLALLTVQARLGSLQPPFCFVFLKDAHREKLSGKQEAFLFIGLYLLAFGSAGVNASLPSHGADQFDERDTKEAKQMSTFFNSLFLALCIGGAVSLTLNVYIEDNNGWVWGFGISTVAIILGTLIFASGLPLYRMHVARTTNGIMEIIQVNSLIHNILMESNSGKFIFLKRTENLIELVDERLGSEVNPSEAINLMKVALLCTDVTPSVRPTMSEVVKMLEGRMSIPNAIPQPRDFSEDIRFKATRDMHQQRENHTLSTKPDRQFSRSPYT